MVHILLAVIYLSFISLGLPDALLGSAWPEMVEEFSVPLSYAGIISTIIAAGTVVSSLLSDRFNRKLGTGTVTALSVGLTAIALFGFSVSHTYISLLFWAIPYGLGAGSVDAALNNYVALHYESRHMSWLHCMWGIGAAIGPSIMSGVLTHGMLWNSGYRIISIMQAVLTGIILLSLPLWKKGTEENNEPENESESHALSLKEIIEIKGVKEVIVCFFCYSAIEQTAGMWAASYLTLFKGVPAETAAGFASMFYIGITVGRAINGFVTMKFSDRQLIRIGEVTIALGIILMVLPFGTSASLAGFMIVGLGCAPIYPCIIHSTPENFGKDKSQMIIGVEMAGSYTGTCLMPPLFGIIANHISPGLLPVYLCLALLLMGYMHELLEKKTGK